MLTMIWRVCWWWGLLRAKMSDAHDLGFKCSVSGMGVMMPPRPGEDEAFYVGGIWEGMVSG